MSKIDWVDESVSHLNVGPHKNLNSKIEKKTYLHLKNISWNQLKLARDMITRYITTTIHRLRVYVIFNLILEKINKNLLQIIKYTGLDAERLSTPIQGFWTYWSNNRHVGFCGDLTLGTHGGLHGPHRKGRSSPQDDGLRLTAQLGAHRKAPRRHPEDCVESVRMCWMYDSMHRLSLTRSDFDLIGM